MANEEKGKLKQALIADMGMEIGGFTISATEDPTTVKPDSSVPKTGRSRRDGNFARLVFEPNPHPAVRLP